MFSGCYFWFHNAEAIVKGVSLNVNHQDMALGFRLYTKYRISLVGCLNKEDKDEICQLPWCKPEDNMMKTLTCGCNVA